VSPPRRRTPNLLIKSVARAWRAERGRAAAVWVAKARGEDGKPRPKLAAPCSQGVRSATAGSWGPENLPASCCCRLSYRYFRRCVQRPPKALQWRVEGRIWHARYLENQASRANRKKWTARSPSSPGSRQGGSRPNAQGSARWPYPPSSCGGLADVKSFALGADIIYYGGGPGNPSYIQRSAVPAPGRAHPRQRIRGSSHSSVGPFCPPPAGPTRGVQRPSASIES
jgi:hypothetical protein